MSDINQNMGATNPDSEVKTENSSLPTLELFPEGSEPAAPKLELEVAPPVQEVQTADLTEKPLSPEEQKLVDDFSQKIDLTNSNLVLQYGVGVQKKIADFSESTLSNVRNKDFGELGDILTQVVGELKEFDGEEEPKGIFGIFKKAGDKISNMKSKYEKTEVTINKIASQLEEHQITLLKDVAMLDKMYDFNKEYFKEITLYIIAGKKKLKEVQEKDLVELKAKAQQSGLPEDAQAANDLASMCNRFEKKIYDLDLTRTICLQTAPQIRLVQNNDTVMAEKIQSTIINTIPLWKSQMVLALGIAHSQQAAQAQRQVSDMTNQMLKKNAQMLKMSTIETARESERGVVDIETLRETNAAMISTLDEVMQIQQEGREKRAAAEVELRKIESELKEKLLSMR